MLAKPNVLDSLITWMFRQNIRGNHRIFKLLRQHQPYYLVRARSKHGLLFNLDPYDCVDSIVLKYGYFEEEVLTSLLEHVGSNGVLWDIGANIGLHSITVKHLCPKVQVVSFEPSPFTFSRLYLNASLNHADLLLFNIGLGNSTGYPKLSLNISGNSGQTSFRPWGHVSYQHSMLCFCDTAANLVRNGTVPMPTVLKVDVEGFELEVISGFQEFLESRELNTIVFESRPDFIENSGCYPIYRLLRQAGFEISPLYSDKKDENSRPTNFIAKR